MLLNYLCLNIMKLKYTKRATNEHFYLRLRLEKKRVRNSILHFACVNKPKIKPLKRKLKPEQNLRLFVKYRSLNYINKLFKIES